MQIKLKSLLMEAMEKLFHATNLHTLLEILKSDSLKFTYADGTGAEVMINKGYPFYLSTSREKYGGYARSGNYPATLVLNGPAMKNVGGIKMASVDYWGSMGRPEQSETEERIFSQKQNISGLKKYLFEIFIFIDENLYNPEIESPNNAYIRLKNTIYPLIDACKSSGIPCYFYIGNTRSKQFTAYKMQRKELSHDGDHVQHYFNEIEKNSEKLKQFLSTASADDLLPYRRSGDYLKKDINELEFVSRVISEPELFATYDLTPKDEGLARTLRYFTNYTDELVPVISSTIHNRRSDHLEVFQTLSKAIRKHKYSSLKDALLSTSKILIAMRAIADIWDREAISIESKLNQVERSWAISHLSKEKKARLIDLLRTNAEAGFDKNLYKEIADIIR